MTRGGKSHFDPDDVALLEDVMDLVPDLDAVAYAAKLVRQRATYPIVDREGLGRIFEDRPDRAVSFKDRTVTFEDVEQFVPKSFFPIESERHFLCRMFIAFHLGRAAHAQEEAGGAESAPAEDHVRLPSPQPLGISYRQAAEPGRH